MRSKYTQEERDKVLVLWNANMSAQRIADRIGVTKNTVISMLRRMRKQGLHVRTEKAPNKNPYKKPRVPHTQKRAPPQALIVYETPTDFKYPTKVLKSNRRWVPLLHLNDSTCRYTKDGKLFCNAPSKGSYCEEHSQKMGSGYHAGVQLKSFIR